MGDSIRKFTELPLQNQPALGVRVICDIPPTSDLENIFIDLTGTVQLTTGSSGLLSDGIPNVIEAVELIGDGRDTIASLPFYQVVNGNMFRRKWGNVPLVTQPGLGIAVNAFEVTGMLDLAAFGAIRPKDSSLRENRYKTLQLAFRFSTSWVGVYGGAFVASATTFNLIVKARETIELVSADGTASAPIFRPQFSARDDVVSAAITRQRFRLTPEQALRGISMRVLTTAGVLSDAVLSRVRVYVGKDLRMDLSAASLKNGYKYDAAGAIPTGWYFLDFADGEGATDKLSDCLDLRQAITQGADAYLEYDTLAGGTFNIAQYGFIRQ